MNNNYYPRNLVKFIKSQGTKKSCKKKIIKIAKIIVAYLSNQNYVRQEKICFLMFAAGEGIGINNHIFLLDLQVFYHNLRVAKLIIHQWFNYRTIMYFFLFNYVLVHPLSIRTLLRTDCLTLIHYLLGL